jgi:large subunit ribosomal protein L18
VNREIDRKSARVRRHLRVRRKVQGSLERPRLCVFKSLRHTYAQVIDDTTGRTLAAASTEEKDVASGLVGTGKLAAAAAVGKAIAVRTQEAGCAQVVFDRGGWPYHGRIRQVAEAAREAGLDF